MKEYIGIDDCRGGWVAAVLGDRLELIFSETLEEMRDLVASSTLTLIDMPMGLKSEGDGERVCDVEARKFLKRRKMSIFPVPCRQAVYSENYREANKVNREILGKGLSKQSYNLFPKIREVDNFITKDSEILENIIEGHPEISFARLRGEEMKHNKRSIEGFQERMEVIEKFFPGADSTVEIFMEKYKRSVVARDDILDAIILAIAASSHREGYLTVPEIPSVDSHGIPMRIFIPRIGR
ncbi:hypothetical protein PM10SUCC1_29270 [Propionigenium maris DSM 9537]|uniref:DUF429 domain-containing protein n=1 Tax=Propionigenium maris DSM 9537 TaxID=1123000 RepID=A0A9W6GLQ8_9FUSO|nr:DUF429 domain-containing protein [Propionigenium maris]GLI57413.1 hypothetical protein PM10SUCC1_29270 [Propionigenium maris DSM 9537]